MSTSNHPVANGKWEMFQNRNFRLLWSSQAVSQIGDGLTKVALLWFVYQLTGSALKMTIIGLLQTIPPLLLSPIIGVYLDRLPKKPVMVTLDIIRAVLIALIPILFLFDALSLEVLFVLVFFTAIFSTAFGPALAASLPLLVKPSELMPANSLLQTTTNLGMLIGPAICGMLIAWLGTENVLYVNAVTFLLSAMFLFPIKGRLLTPDPGVAKAAPKMTEDLLVGMRFVFQEKPVLRSLLLTTVFFTLGASAFVYVLPLFVNDYLDADPLWLGWLWSSMGAGMLITSFCLSMVKNLGKNARFLLIGFSLVVGGSALQFLAHAHSIMWGFILVTIIGACTAAFTPIAWSIIQESTPNHLMGRVFTLINTASMAMASGGMVAFGGVADTFGALAGIFMISLVFLGTGIMVLFSHRSAIPGAQLFTGPGWEPSLSTNLPKTGGCLRINFALPKPIGGNWLSYFEWVSLTAVSSSLKRFPQLVFQHISRAPP
jgi:MFS transporter, DHA3 family, macrolide efflux protein